MAAVSPRQVGTMDGLIAVDKAISGAELRPNPKTPSPNIAFLRGLLTLFTISILYLALSFYDSTTKVGFMNDIEIKPVKVATMPPTDNGIIMAERAGIDITA